MFSHIYQKNSNNPIKINEKMRLYIKESMDKTVRKLKKVYINDSNINNKLIINSKIKPIKTIVLNEFKKNKMQEKFWNEGRYVYSFIPLYIIFGVGCFQLYKGVKHK
jgi:hypothetical protein